MFFFLKYKKCSNQRKNNPNNELQQYNKQNYFQHFTYWCLS